MSSTDELRQMLDERGVEWYEAGGVTFFGTSAYGTRYAASEPECGIALDPLTPEQAIAATLPNAASTHAALLQESKARMALQRDYNNQIKRIQNQRKQLREMQAALERKTCHDLGDERIFHCSECGFGFSDVYLSDEDYLRDDDGELIEPWPPFCPNCGRRCVG